MQKIFQTDRAELQKFGKTLLIMGPIVGAAAIGFGLWRGHAFPRYAGGVLFALALYSALTTFTLPILLFPVYVVFTTVGNIVQWIISTIVLSFVYYVMLSPIALLFRVMRRDRLKIRLGEAAKSYWEIKKSASDDPSRYEKQY